MSPRRPPSALHVTVSTDGVRTPVAAARLAAAAERVLRAEQTTSAMVSVTLVTAAAMARLNRRHLGHAGPTDVIAFGFRDPRGAVVGDVYLCPSVARENAKRFGVGVREELLRLAVHGTLHVLGHEHPEGAARFDSPMWRRQELLLARAMRA